MNEGGMSQMREMPTVDVKAGGTVSFEPGGKHIMLVGLSHPLVAGDSFPLTLTFAHAGAITTNVTVSKDMPAGPTMPGMKM